MFFPLRLSDISLWLGATALILLTTSELFSYLPRFALRFTTEKRRLRLVGFGCGFGFLVTLAISYLIPEIPVMGTAGALVAMLLGLVYMAKRKNNKPAIL